MKNQGKLQLKSGFAWRKHQELSPDLPRCVNGKKYLNVEIALLVSNSKMTS